MKNRTVVKLLACLGQRNINSLDSYLHSFYGNQECVALFDAMKECAPKFSNKKMQTEQVWQRSFPTKKISANRLDKLCFQLHGHVTEFMAWQEMREDAITREKLFLNAANRYEIREVVEETLEGLAPLIKEEKKTEIWTNEALIEVYHHQYFSTNLMRKKDKGRQAFMNAIENLDTFYLTYRTLLETEKRIRTYVLNEEFQEYNFEGIRNLLKETHTKNLTSSHFRTLESFLKEEIKTDVSYYDVLEEEVFNLLPDLHILDQETVLNFLFIVANYYSKQGKARFGDKIFKILKYGVESGASIKNNSMTHMFFINLVNVACNSKEIKWIEKFLQDYQSYLPTDVRAETVRLSVGLIAFGKEEFLTTKKILEGKRLSINRHNMRGRWLLTKTYYELQDDKLVEECDAFYQFLYREKEYNDMNQKGTLNFLKAIELLINPNVKKNEIVRFFDSCEVISQISWLNQKVKERKV